MKKVDKISGHASNNCAVEIELDRHKMVCLFKGPFQEPISKDNKVQWLG